MFLVNQARGFPKNNLPIQVEFSRPIDRPSTAMLSALESITLLLSASQLDGLRLASAQLVGAERRAFQGAIALKWCEGNTIYR